MKSLRFGIFVVMLGILTACPSNGSQSIFTADNSFGSQIPPGANEITPEAFEKQVQSGEITLITALGTEQQRKAEQEQLVKDRTFLEGLPDKSDALKSLLAPKSGVELTPNGDYILEVTGNAQPFKVLTLGDAAMFRSLVDSYQDARQPENALSIYEMSYLSLGQSLKDKLPTVESLKGKPLGEILKATADMNALLEKVQNLDAVTPASDGAQSLRPQSVTITEGGAGAGNGTDNNGPCPSPSGNGLFSLVNWPLKFFISPVKNQAQRGTCWDFTAVGALESRERVVNNLAPDFSEQYVNNVQKRNTVLGIDLTGEGAFASQVLDKFVDLNLTIPNETAWNYNPARNLTGSRPSDICAFYSGLCSNTNHQSPVTCTTNANGAFCGFTTVNYAGSSSVHASRSRVVWENTVLQPDVSVAIMRNLLANGQALMAGFGVYPGFDNPNNGTINQGYVTDFNGSASRGGHETLIVGFVPDGVVATAPVVPGGTGGGFFVLKNSWGCYAGDAGFYYIPVRYIQRFFGYIRVLEMPATRSPAWADTIEALRPPNLSLNLPGHSTTTVDLNRLFTVQAVLSGGGAGCCVVAWLPAPTFPGALIADYRFDTEGEHTIRATVRTSRGVQVIRDIVVNVVNTPPSMGISGPLPLSADPFVHTGTASNFRASARDINEPGGVLRDNQVTWTITRPDGTTENRAGYSFAYTWSQLGTYHVQVFGHDSQGVIRSLERHYTVSNDAPSITNLDAAIITPRPDQHIKPNLPIDLLINPPIPPDPKKIGPLTYLWTVTYSQNGQTKSLEIGKSEKFTWTPSQTPDFGNLSTPLEIQLKVEITDTLYGTQGNDTIQIVLDKDAQ